MQINGPLSDGVYVNQMSDSNLSKPSCVAVSSQAPPEHAVILLASGLSKRLGQPKQLLTIDAQPLLEVMTLRALATSPKAVMLVVPESNSVIHSLAKTLAAQHDVLIPVFNSYPEQGMAYSLNLGIDALNKKVAQGLSVKRVVIMGVDQILLDTAHLHQLLLSSEQSVHAIADNPVDNYEPANNKNLADNKVVASNYGRSYKDLPELLSNKAAKPNTNIMGLPITIDYERLTQWQSRLTGDKGLRDLIRNLDDKQLHVIDNIRLSLDIDTPEQLSFSQQQGWLDR